MNSKSFNQKFIQILIWLLTKFVSTFYLPFDVFPRINGKMLKVTLNYPPNDAFTGFVGVMKQYRNNKSNKFIFIYLGSI